MKDDIKMLKQINAGAKMAIGTLERVYPFANCAEYKDSISEYIKKHEDIVARSRLLLSNYRKGGKDPSFVGEKMAEMTTRLRLSQDSSDSHISTLIIEGCNMGIKKLKEYKGKYKYADKSSIDLLTELVNLERKLTSEMQSYL